ncbi:hypothetical protein [Xenorhabdus budapestensis]|uniref:Uncharacterized protein n=1 Tax=Xenorhabdus budapestensis TaxID=290110 RepID=A0A2D0J3W9_XENBU|nr:hypothetical protein [Xenorhabdus budapestensis]PHM29111.1 hypothetical protein Xbud_00552 [Xenorhabdus budapestensis]
MINNSFHLTQIIASVWGDPADITHAVWQAGYRKPERKEEDIAALVIDVMKLNSIIFDATWEGKATPAKVAKVILGKGYRKGDK